MTAKPETRVEELLARLTVAQKVRLLTGADFWSLHAEPEVGLRAMVVSDGPSGVRGAEWDERDPSLNLPSATALAATWDTDLAYRYGAAAAHEARRKGVDVVLGPTINLHRSPLGGRHFEAYSEDPLLTGELAEAFVQGCQDNGVGACPKHYVANDFETERFSASVEVSEQALHEVYLAPFERAVTGGRAWTVMSAYNAVGGTTMSEHPLLSEPLKGSWGFDGVVISDWTAVRSLASAAAAQDLVMPGPGGPWGDALVDAVGSGEIPVEVVDDKVRRLLLLAARVGALEGVDGGSHGPAPVPDTGGPRRPTDDADIALAREVETRGIVLVRNDGTLPLVAGRGPAPTSVAVLGQSALRPRTQGGGSATVVPVATVSPLDGLRAALPDATVTHATGALVHDGVLPFPLAEIRDPTTGEPGIRVRFLDADGSVLLDEVRRATDLMWLGNAPDGQDFDAETVLDAELVVAPEDFGAALMAPPSTTARVDVEAGRTYRLRWTHPLTGIPSMPDGSDLPGVLGFTAGWRPVVDRPDDLIAEAVEGARSADVAVVVVGTNEKVESEGFDRTHLSLPGHQDALVAAVAAANPRTVVVVSSGSPVVMPWRDDVAAVLLTWFGGQEYGHALADVLTGAAEPGGRLPTTWPARQEDVPVLDVTPRDGVVRYDEGVHLGHRAWLRAGVAPAYPFGFGLGYTTWSYDEVEVTQDGGGDRWVTVGLTNTGGRRGREVVQVYLSRPGSAVERPVRWLAGWTVVSADPGAHATADVRVRPRAFEHWDSDVHGWSTEPGQFTVEVARHAGTTDLTTTVTV
jgi:beta-glucosidase